MTYAVAETNFFLPRHQSLVAAPHETAAPEVHRVLASPERLGNPRAGPATERQQHRPCAVGLTALPRRCQNFKRRPLRLACLHWRFASHAPPPNQGQYGITALIRWLDRRSLLRPLQHDD